MDISAGHMFCGVGEGNSVLGPESFVQQIGRCARRPGESGDVYLVVGEEGETPKFAEALEEGAEISPETKRLINAMNEAAERGACRKKRRVPGPQACTVTSTTMYRRTPRFGSVVRW